MFTRAASLFCLAALLALPAFATEPPPSPPAGATPPGMPAGEPGQPPAAKVPTDLPVIKTTDLGDGLIAEDLKLGTGAEVPQGATLVAHYHGTFKADGKIIDSSYKNGEPSLLRLADVIQGWQKGVPGMKLGGIRRLIIPSKLAWGDQGRPPVIPPNSDVVFIIEVIDTIHFEDTQAGSGEVVGPNDFVATAHTIKTSDGKEVDKATRDQPYIWIPGELPGIEGMKVGGKRRINLPAQANKADPRLPPTKRPNDVALTIEVEVLSVRKLGG